MVFKGFRVSFYRGNLCFGLVITLRARLFLFPVPCSLFPVPCSLFTVPFALPFAFLPTARYIRFYPSTFTALTAFSNMPTKVSSGRQSSSVLPLLTTFTITQQLWLASMYPATARL